jgi:hypothetical protein
MTTLAMRAVNVPRMTRVTWYKHRALMLGIPGLFLLAAALLVIDSVLQRHWVSSHHLTYCLTYANNDTSGTYANNDTSSRCLSATASSQLGVFGIFINYWRTEVPVVAVFALAASSRAVASGSPGPRASVRFAGCSARSDRSRCSPG